jgi:hypothetical protein
MASEGKLSIERRERLNKLGFSWDPRTEQWEEGYEHLKEYQAREGHGMVPTDYREEDGFRLGGWVSRQRSAARAGALTDDRRKLLEQLSGWSWKLPSGPKKRKKKDS